MSIKRYKPEQIVTLLRQIEVKIPNGKTTPRAHHTGLLPLAEAIRRPEAGSSETVEGAG